MKWQRWHAIAGVAAVVAVGLSTCKRCGTPATGSDAGAAIEPAPAAPEDLLCEIYVAEPNAAWSRLQRGVGGAVGILPATLPGVFLALTDLDASLATELDGTAPIFGVVAGETADPGVAFAIKVVDARRARALLTEGEASRFTSKPSPGMTQLIPKRTSPVASYAIAITQNGYLLVTRREADLARLGPYVTRSLPARPLPTNAAVIDVPRSALQGALKSKLESFWKDGKSFLLTQDERMRAERGRAPDFGDPAAIVGVLDAALAQRVAIFGDLERVRVTLDVTEDAVVLAGTLTPSKEGAVARAWINGMQVGDASSILALPAASALAISFRDGEESRAAQAKDLEAAIRAALGARLKDPERIHDVIDAATKARDASVAAALTIEDPPGLLVRASVRDPSAANKAMSGVVELAKVEPFKELLRVRDVTTATEDLAGIGKVSVALLARDTKRVVFADAGAPRPGHARPPAKLGIAWLVEEPDGAPPMLSLGAGSEPLLTMKMGLRPERRLADEPTVKRFTDAVGDGATTLVVAQPLKLDPKRANLPLAPLGVAIGRKGGDAFFRVDVADALLREAARWQMGF